MRRVLLSVVACICALSVAMPAWAFTLAFDFFGEVAYDEKGIMVSQDIYAEDDEAVNFCNVLDYGVGAVDYNLSWNRFPAKNKTQSWYVHIDIWIDGEYHNNDSNNADFFLEYQDSFLLGECSLKTALKENKEIINLITKSPEEYYEPGVGGYHRDGNLKSGQMYGSLENKLDEILRDFTSSLNLKNANATFGGTISLATVPEPENLPGADSVLLRNQGI